MTMKANRPEREPTHPGIFLREEVLPHTPVTKTELAAALGISRAHLYGILNGIKPVTPETAVKLAAFFDVSPDVWLTMQQRYDIFHAQKRLASKIREIRQLREAS